MFYPSSPLSFIAFDKVPLPSFPLCILDDLWLYDQAETPSPSLSAVCPTPEGSKTIWIVFALMSQVHCSALAALGIRKREIDNSEFPLFLSPLALAPFSLRLSFLDPRPLVPLVVRRQRRSFSRKVVHFFPFFYFPNHMTWVGTVLLVFFSSPSVSLRFRAPVYAAVEAQISMVFP